MKMLKDPFNHTLAPFYAWVCYSEIWQQLFSKRRKLLASECSFFLLNYPYLYPQKHNSVVPDIALHNSVYEQSSLTNTFTARNFHFPSLRSSLLRLARIQIKTELNLRYSRVRSVRCWLCRSFSAFLLWLNSHKTLFWTENNRKLKFHVRKPRKPSIEWTECSQISRREEKFFQFSLFSLLSPSSMPLLW